MAWTDKARAASAAARRRKGRASKSRLRHAKTWEDVFVGNPVRSAEYKKQSASRRAKMHRSARRKRMGSTAFNPSVFSKTYIGGGKYLRSRSVKGKRVRKRK